MSKSKTSTALPPADDSPLDNCGNVYRIVQLKEGDDYNDFGQRYCPFCGQMTNEW
jgi:hypothetical protein